MAAGVWFWIIFVIAIVFGCYANRTDLQGGKWQGFGGNIVIWVLIALLGWKAFGSPLQ